VLQSREQLVALHLAHVKLQRIGALMAPGDSSALRSFERRVVHHFYVPVGDDGFYSSSRLPPARRRFGRAFVALRLFDSGFGLR
jgi:hypothetical protein